MFKAFKRLWNEDRGNILVIFGAALPLLVGAAGLATDTIEWTLWKRQLQRAADSAAIAGVYTRIATDTQAAVEGSVNDDLALNYRADVDRDAGYPITTRLANDGDKRNQVQVVLQLHKSLPFSSMFMASAPRIRATAIAASVPGADEFCVLATDSSVGSVGIEVTGSTRLDLGNCSLMTNSRNPNTAASNGNAGGGNAGSNSWVHAKSLAATGGVKYSNSWDVSDYDPNSPSIADPYASKSAPSQSDCTKTVTADMSKNQTYSSGVQDRTSGANADTAGDVVCFSGSEVKVQGELKLQSGVTYVIDGGDLTMSSTSSKISCGGCTIVMTNFSNPAATGNVKITGGTLDITAPTTGPYAGMAIFQDSRARDSGTSGQNVIQGNNGASVTGALYFGNRSLTYTGGSDTVFACLQIVSKRVTFTGNSAMRTASDCPGRGYGAIQGGRRVRLVA
nr:pilus assembly protein TadG-related protein [uncultured Sphingomonas sp.]